MFFFNLKLFESFCDSKGNVFSGDVSIPNKRAASVLLEVFPSKSSKAFSQCNGSAEVWQSVEFWNSVMTQLFIEKCFWLWKVSGKVKVCIYDVLDDT